MKEAFWMDLFGACLGLAFLIAVFDLNRWFTLPLLVLAIYAGWKVYEDDR